MMSCVFVSLTGCVKNSLSSKMSMTCARLVSATAKLTEEPRANPRSRCKAGLQIIWDMLRASTGSDMTGLWASISFAKSAVAETRRKGVLLANYQARACANLHLKLAS